MPYTLTVTPMPGYLHCEVRGTNSAAAVRGYLAEVNAACARSACPAVLIDENLSGPSLDVGTIFGIASVGSQAITPTMRAIAYVDTNPQHERAKMEFAETVAVNRGINVRRFDSVAAAAEWLRESAGRRPR